jgi:protein TonB
VEPVYPPFAKQARIEGTVVLEGIITTEGRVASIKLISGHPMLVQAAMEAASQWVYEPTRLNNEPVSVIFTITVNFRLHY